MLKLHKFLYVLLVLGLVVGFVGCDDDDDDDEITTSTGITIYWDNQSSYSVDFYLDGVLVQSNVASGQSATTTEVSMGTHSLMGCVAGYEPHDVGYCEGEDISITADFTYTMN